MRKTFSVAFRLRNAYRTNSIIWALKGIPLIKRLLPAALYANRGLKTFANIVSGIAEVCSAFLGKFFYLGFFYLIVDQLHLSPADSVIHMFIFFTVVGGILNTYIFNPTKDKYYAMFIMRIDAKEYTLTGYAYFLLKSFAGFIFFSLLTGALWNLPPAALVAAPFYVLFVKLCFTAWSLADCRKQNKSVNENRPASVIWIGSAILLAAAILPPLFGYALGGTFLCVLTAALLLPAAMAARYILRFREYRPIYKELLNPAMMALSSSKSSAGAAQQLAMQKKITSDVSVTSDKSGYRYFNELFIKRHAKLLTKSARRITCVAAAFFALSIAALFVYPQAKTTVNGMLMSYLPYFLFIMYLLNRGRIITQAMFFSCDHSMLAYRFYRRPKAVLSLFTARLKAVVLINLAPAFVIALGLPLLLYVSGGTAQTLNYAVLFVSVIAMSVFFSVHNMVLYYLLQPYNVNLESKSAAFGIVNWITYIVCYAGVQLRLPTLYFGSAVTAFCVLYVALSFVIAYRLAPRTFKLRN